MDFGFYFIISEEWRQHFKQDSDHNIIFIFKNYSFCISYLLLHNKLSQIQQFKTAHAYYLSFGESGVQA